MGLPSTMCSLLSKLSQRCYYANPLGVQELLHSESLGFTRQQWGRLILRVFASSPVAFRIIILVAGLSNRRRPSKLAGTISAEWKFTLSISQATRLKRHRVGPRFIDCVRPISGVRVARQRETTTKLASSCAPSFSGYSPFPQTPTSLRFLSRRCYQGNNTLGVQCPPRIGARAGIDIGMPAK